MEQEEPLEFSDNLLRGNAACHHNTMAHARMLVEDGHELNSPAIFKAVEDKVIAPDVVLVRWPKTHAAAIACAQASALALFSGYLVAALTPEAMVTLLVYPPALTTQKRRDLAVARAGVLPGKLRNASCKALVLLRRRTRAALGGQRLCEHVASPPLAHARP